MHKYLLIALTSCLACSNAADPSTPDVGPTRVDGGTVDAGTDARYAGLVINEVAASGTPDDWFELHNTSAAPIDLSGVSYSDEPTTNATKAVFPAGTTIAAGGYLLKTVNDTDPGFKLGSDEVLGLFAPSGAPIDLVDWAEGESPAGQSYGRFPNGTGAFKTLATPTPGAANQDGANPCGNGALDGAEVCDGVALNGRSCTTEGFASGTLRCRADCGALDTSACVAASPIDVVINEVASVGDDLIELYNRGDRQVDLSGWAVHDADYVAADPATADQRYVLAAGSTIAAGGYLVLTKGTDHSFGLGDVDRLVLQRTDGTAADETSWTASQANPSWCRLPSGTGAFATCAATFGATNAERPAVVCGDGVIGGTEACDGAALGVRTCMSEGFASGTLGCARDCASVDTSACVARAPAVVINEASSEGNDNIELYNAGTAVADLAGWSVIDSDPTNTAYVFPAGVTLGVGAYLVLTRNTEHTFGLGGTDGVTLRDAGGATIDTTSWPASGAIPAWCRRPDGTGAFATCTAATFGATNGP